MKAIRRAYITAAALAIFVATSGLAGNTTHAVQSQNELRALTGAPITEHGEGVAKQLSPGDAPVVLKVDDGSFEEALGVVDPNQTTGSQAVFLNRFTIDESLLPFTVDTISILFPVSTSAGSTFLTPGSPFDLLVYVDPDGTGNPANTTLKTQQRFFIQPSNSTFQDVKLGLPLVIQSGDIWVGFSNFVTSQDHEPIFPAALDDNSGVQGRSWAFFNTSIGDDFEGPLDQADAGVVIQGNWLIRAVGQAGGATCVRWDAPASLRGDGLPPPLNTRLCDMVPPAKADGLESPRATLMGYNVYRSNQPNVQTTDANRFASVPPSQTNVGSSVSPDGSFFVITAMYDTGESGPSSEIAIVPPSIDSLKVKNIKIKALGINFTGPVQVFMDGIPFLSPPVLKKNDTKLIQRGNLITGETIGNYLAAHNNRARIDFRNANGALRSVEFQR